MAPGQAKNPTWMIWTISFALLPQSGTSFCSMTFRFSTSWTTLELDVSNTRTRLLVSRDSVPNRSLWRSSSNQVCVCVTHLNRCKTSAQYVLLFLVSVTSIMNSAGACSTVGILHATKLLPSVGSRVWSTLCTCVVFLVWQRAKPRTRHDMDLMDYFLCIVAAIWNFFLFYDFQVFDVMDDSGIGGI